MAQHSEHSLTIIRAPIIKGKSMTNLAWKHISIETSLHLLHPVVNSRKSRNLIFSFAIPSVLLVTQQGAENYNANTGDRRCVERRSFTPMSQLCYALCRSLLKTLERIILVG